MFVVLTEVFKRDEKGVPIIVRAESCISGAKRKIHVRDIHDFPYESGWSIVPKSEYAGAREQIEKLQAA